MPEIILLIFATWLLLFGQMQILWSWYRKVSKQMSNESKRLGLTPEKFDWKQASNKLRINVAAFVIFDWWVNMTTITIRFLQLPHSPGQVVTSRLKKWREDYEGKKPSQLSLIQWNRRIFAVNMCQDLLDKHDPSGDHC